MFKGVVLSVVAACAFAGLCYYATLLKPLSGEEVFGWRMLLTLPCVTLFLLLGREWKPVRDIIIRIRIRIRIRQRPALLLGLVCSSALLGVQQWLFLWAPVNGRRLQVRQASTIAGNTVDAACCVRRDNRAAARRAMVW